MKVILIKDNGSTVGWTIQAESVEDKLILGSMRNLQFFGMGDNAVEYNGMDSDPEDDDYVIAMHYATKRYHQKQRLALIDKINLSTMRDIAMDALKTILFDPTTTGLVHYTSEDLAKMSDTDLLAAFEYVSHKIKNK